MLFRIIPDRQYYKTLFSATLFLLTGSLVYAQLGTVTTANGFVSGNIKSEISIFKGIPFAAPPIGALRWKAPQPAPDWSGVRQCSAFAASPFQPKPVPFLCWSEEFIAPPEPLSEDCLYLNIWTAAKNNKEKYPYWFGFMEVVLVPDLLLAPYMMEKRWQKEVLCL